MSNLCPFKKNYFIEVGDTGGKESAYNAGAVGDVSLIPGWGRSPGEGNGNHSSILSWRIPWTEEPGRLQSVALQRVGQDLVTKQQP